MRISRSMLLAAMVTLAACGGGGDPGTAPSGGNNGGNNGGGTGGGGGGSTSTSISVNDNNFSPNATTVPVGSTVTWTWNGSNTHNVTFSDGSSGNKSSGSYQKTFQTAGTFNYDCTLHPGMTGSVKVQ